MTEELLHRVNCNEYADYLRTNHWKQIKNSFYASPLATRYKGHICCAACKLTGITVKLHHKTYERIGKELLADLVLLCDNCYEECQMYHSYKYSNLPLRKATDKFIKKKRNKIWAEEQKDADRNMKLHIESLKRNYPNHPLLKCNSKKREQYFKKEKQKPKEVTLFGQKIR